MRHTYHRHYYEEMGLPTRPKREPRPVPATFRLSKRVVQAIKELAEKHNMSQADVIEFLVRQEIGEK